MTATEKFKRAESLFQDKTKRELAEMVVHREGDLEDARADNAKLRERVDELEGLTDGKRYIPQEWYQLVTSDNAKLREMVERVLALRHDPVYKWLDAATAEIYGKSFTEQARELGMEADE